MRKGYGQNVIGVGVLGEIDGFPWQTIKPGEPGIALYLSTETTEKDTYGHA